MSEKIIKEISWDETDKGYSIFYRDQLYVKVSTLVDLSIAIHELVNDEIKRIQSWS